jgi:RNA polymerase sigma factor (sigma-70 family)
MTERHIPSGRWENLDPADPAETVRAAQAGDRQAWSNLAAEYLDQVYDHCRWVLRNIHDAQDATQRTFELAQARLGQLRDPSSFRAWLFKIAEREACAVRKESLASGGDRRSDTDLIELPDGASPVDEQVHRTHLQALVWEAIGSLNHADKALLSLHLRRGLRGQELADAVDERRSRVDVRLHRAKRSFEDAFTVLVLARHGRSHCPALDRILEAESAPPVGALPTSLSRKIARHIERCGICDQQRRQRLSPSVLLGTVPLLAAPGWLRDRLVGSVRDLTEDDHHDRDRRTRDRRGRRDRSQYPRPPSGSSAAGRRRRGGRASRIAPILLLTALLLLAAVALPRATGGSGGSSLQAGAPSQTGYPSPSPTAATPGRPAPGPSGAVTSQPGPGGAAPGRTVPGPGGTAPGPAVPGRPGPDGIVPGAPGPGGGENNQPAQLQLYPSEIDFGSAEDTREATVKNVGGRPSDIGVEPAQLPDWLEVEPPTQALQPGSTDSIFVAINRELMLAGSFERRVDIVSMDGPARATLTIRGTVDPPSTPVLTSPADAATVTQLTLRLSWREAPRASEYIVRIDRQKFSTVCSNGFCVPQPAGWESESSTRVKVPYLERSFATGTWRWQVIGVSAAGSAGPASEWRTFTVEARTR